MLTKERQPTSTLPESVAIMIHKNIIRRLAKAVIFEPSWDMVMGREDGQATVQTQPEMVQHLASDLVIHSCGPWHVFGESYGFSHTALRPKRGVLLGTNKASRQQGNQSYRADTGRELANQHAFKI